MTSTETQIEALSQAIDNLKLDIVKLLDENESLRQKLAVAEEALGFYASIGIWGNGCAAIDPCDTYFCDKNVLRGGIKAREALAKIRGEG